MTDIKPRLEAIITKYKNAAGLKVAICKIPSRRIYQATIIEMKKMYRMICKEMKVKFIEYNKFTYIGTSGDGVHPDPKHIQILSKDIFKGVNSLRLTQ